MKESTTCTSKTPLYDHTVYIQSVIEQHNCIYNCYTNVVGSLPHHCYTTADKSQQQKPFQH